jgi:hypothetical protein
MDEVVARPLMIAASQPLFLGVVAADVDDRLALSLRVYLEKETRRKDSSLPRKIR